MRNLACPLATLFLLAACQAQPPVTPVKPAAKPDPILTVAGVLIKQDPDGAYFAGSYKAKAQRDELNYWIKGTVSTRDADATSYYEDEPCTKRIGVAKHDKGLKGGSFVFDDGPTLKYRLEDF